MFVVTQAMIVSQMTRPNHCRAALSILADTLSSWMYPGGRITQPRHGDGQNLRGYDF